MTTFVTLAAHWSPGQSPPSPTGTAAWPCRPGVRLPETVVAFARWYLWWVETVIAFAGAKWVFLVQFSGAEVMSVSAVPCWGRAVVLLVSTSPRCCALCAKKFALRGLMVGVSAKKFALHARNTPKSAFLRLMGELFRGSASGGAVLGEFFRANRPCAQVL